MTTEEHEREKEKKFIILRIDPSFQSPALTGRPSLERDVSSVCGKGNFLFPH